EQPDDRERDPGEVHPGERLPGRGRHVLRADGRDPDRGVHLRQGGRNRAAHGIGGRVSAVASAARSPRRSAWAVTWAFIRRHILTAYSVLFFIYLLLPIGVVIVFSFNNPLGRFNYTWEGFTWNNWRYWDGVPGIRDSIILSLEIALIASLVATALG